MTEFRPPDPMDRSRVVDEVYGKLLESIFSKHIPPGSRLSVPALADQLGVSRTPIREAVLRLVREGLAVEQPRRGAVLVTFDHEELQSLYLVREVLEGLAARLAAEHLTPESARELTEAHALHERAVSAHDLAAHYEHDSRFHELTRLASGNAALLDGLTRVQAKVRLAMSTTSRRAGPEMALRDHRKILEAILRRDPVKAEGEARAHIARLRSYLGPPDDPRVAESSPASINTNAP
ncbi:MAG: GntR family transcriptional regulator [Jatrophihabitans sp.]